MTLPRLQKINVRLSYSHLYYLVPLILTAAVFSVTLHDSFTNWDDNAYVTANALVRSLSLQNICRIFSPSTLVCSNYQPVTILSLAINYALGGLNPAGFIGTNIFLHLVNVLLVFIFIRRISQNELIASLSALLFGIHPMHVESVAWVTGRKDLLCALFYLSALLWYHRYLRKAGRDRLVSYCIIFALLVVSLLSKSAAVTLPLAFLLLDYQSGRKITAGAIVEKLPFLAPSVALGVLAIVSQQTDGSANLYAGMPIAKKLLIGSYSFMFYVTRFFAPIRLSAFYPYPASLPGALPPAYLLSPVFCAACCGLVYLGRRSKVILFGFLFFLINVIFILHFVPIGRTVTADRFSYIAYIGLSYIVASYSVRAFSARRRGIPTAVYVALGFVLTAALCFASFRRCEVWKDSLALWDDVVAKYPCAMAYNSLGSGLMAAGRTGEAIPQFRKAIDLSPGPTQTAEACVNLGDAFLKTGQAEKAVDILRKAVELAPDLFAAHSNLGTALMNSGKVNEATEHYRKAVELAPDLAEAHTDLGAALLQTGKKDEALMHFQQATELDSNNAAAQNILGTVLEESGRPGESIAHFQRAVELAPDLGEAHKNLGNLLFQSGRTDEALEHYRKAAVLSPNDPSAQNSLGFAMVRTGRPNEAIALFRRALELDPGNAEAFFYLSKTYIAARRMDDAIACLRSALAAHPANVDALNDLTYVFLQTGQIDSAIGVATEARSAALASGNAKVAGQIAAEISRLKALGRTSANSRPRAG